MTDAEKEYVRYRKERAQASWEVARWAFEHELLQDSVNRLYYACFYLVSALLLTDGMASSKHTGVRSLFNQHWIKTGRLPVFVGRFYQTLFDKRQEGDYLDGTVFSRHDVERWFNEAQQFIEVISKQIDKRLKQI